MVEVEPLQKTSVPDGVWEFPVESGFVVVRPDSPCLFCMNGSASVIWSAYRATGDQGYAVETLTKAYGVSADRACRDVAAAVNGWAEAGLLGSPPMIPSPEWDGGHGEPSVVAYCSVEGTIFRVLTDSAAVIAEVSPRLNGLAVGPCRPDQTIAVWSCGDDLFAIVAGEECLAIERGVRAARAVLFQELVCRACPGRTWMALLHAAACGMDERCVLFPASSYSGKSTLAAALMGSGFRLYSDDFVGITAGDSLIPAMPFGVALRSGSWDVVRTWVPQIDDCSPVEMYGEQVKYLPVVQHGGACEGTPAAVVFSRWASGADVSKQRLSTADVIGRLHQSGFWVRHDRGNVGAFLAWLDALPKFALRYGDLADAIPRVRALAET